VAALGNRGGKIQEILNALDANSADYSLAGLTPVGTAEPTLIPRKSPHTYCAALRRVAE
jgi:hypothetical protein